MRFVPHALFVCVILESVKKLEKLFIAPKARQILHETAHRALARCECAQHMGFLMKYFHQESVLVSMDGTIGSPLSAAP